MEQIQDNLLQINVSRRLQAINGIYLLYINDKSRRLQAISIDGISASKFPGQLFDRSGAGPSNEEEQDDVIHQGPLADPILEETIHSSGFITWRYWTCLLLISLCVYIQIVLQYLYKLYRYIDQKQYNTHNSSTVTLYKYNDILFLHAFASSLFHIGPLINHHYDAQDIHHYPSIRPVVGSHRQVSKNKSTGPRVLGSTGAAQTYLDAYLGAAQLDRLVD